MTATGVPFVERIWWAAHTSAWFPSWTTFQIAAVIAGGLFVLREGGHRLVAPFAAGVLTAVAGAVLLGSGGEWLRWLTHGAGAPTPELEVAGFGAIAGLVTGHVAVARARGVSITRALDVLAPSIGVMIAVARAGCFFAGCDFGAPSQLPWALRYPVMTPAFRAQADAHLVAANATVTLPVHPTQLYEVCLGLCVVAAVFALRATRRSGDRFAVALVVHAVGRFGTDMLRGDLAHGGAFGLTVTQGLAIVAVGLVVAGRSISLARDAAEEAEEGTEDADPQANPKVDRGAEHRVERHRADLPSAPETPRNSHPTASS